MQVTQRILTNMLPDLFIENSATSYVNAAECKQIGVCITGDDLDEDQKENKLFQIVNGVLFYSLQSRSLQCLRTGM